MDYRVYIGNTDLLNGISTNNVEEMEKIEGISEIHPYNYTLGAVVLNDKQYLMRITLHQKMKTGVY